jgi:hypothetical protein
MDLVEYRTSVIERLTAKARADERIVAAAAVGSTAVGGDRWSDVDLTFAVAGVTVEDLLADWTRDVLAEFDAAELFDVTAGSTTYRVFLFPGALQVDLSFAPAEGFAPRTPRFRLLFGKAGDLVENVAAAPPGEFGLGVHHLIRTNVCIERNKLVQAEYWLHQLRDVALTLACRRLGLSPQYGRGFDDLPSSVLDPLLGALVADLHPEELRRGLRVAGEGLLREAVDSAENVDRVRQILDGILRPSSGTA